MLLLMLVFYSLTGNQGMGGEVRLEHGARGANRCPERNIMANAQPGHSTAMVAMLVSQQNRIDIPRVQTEALETQRELFQGKPVIDQ